MRLLELLILFVLVVIAGFQGCEAKKATPAMVNGRLTGQVTFEHQELLFRSKRQASRRRPSGRRRPRPTTAAPVTEAPVTEAPVTEAPVTEAPVTEPPVTDPPVTDPPVTDPPATEPVTTQPPATTRAQTEAPTACEGRIYRTATGECNNLANPAWGSNEQAFRRLLEVEYTVIGTGDDAVHAPRRYSDQDGTELPNVRLISRVVHDPDHRPSNRPVMTMQWGQFLDHDITATPINPANKSCCYDDLVLNNEQHEDVNTNGPCFPIIIPDEDSHFVDVETRCMENKRSYQINDSSGVPEQINLISAFVDGSQVYGTTDEHMADLRDGASGKGRLLDKGGNLPEGPSSKCVITSGHENTDYCFLAGDSRVNVYPGLGALHTVFMRMHNLIADGLAEGHPEWDDETVFQEARRINIALLQKISYSDWLSVIVGTAASEKYGLDSGNYAYREDANPTLYNVFSTAAFRFGHSMITDGLFVNDVFYESISLFNNPHHVIHSLDSLVMGLVENPMQRVDRWYSTGMTNHMFETSSFNGFDIVSLNIQRGRDHGLGSYYKWRDLCDPDERTISTFDEFGPGGRRYARVYRNVRDIDLYSGALDEVPVDGGSVGKTYACLIGLQFELLKYGDRFWYENQDSPHPFSEVQIREIERQTLATVLCQTTGIDSIQRNVFNGISDNNPLMTCEEMRTLDLTVF